MPSSLKPKTSPAVQAQAPSLEAQAIQEIDTLFHTAGLVRNLRGKSTGVTRRARMKRFTPEELSQAPPVPSIAPNGVQILKIPSWEKPALSWLWHGFSTRKGGLSQAYCTESAPGELNLGFTAADDREAVAQNRRLLVEAVTGDPATPLITLRQIHSSVLVLTTSADASRQNPWKADGLMTAEPGLLLGVQTADCIPVLVADRKLRVVAAFHAGWRGTVKRIVESGIGRMRLEFGSRPEDLLAAIGPGASACCYAVGEEVLSSFESQFAYAGDLFHEVYDTDPVRTKYPMLFLTQRAPGHSPIGPSMHVDLIEANRRQLLDAGLKPRSIHFTGGCTVCHRELFFSHRASQGNAGRMMSVIGIRPR
jgi:purine-nucleoside/S-methyl-5'-thioadenosine phosphorylase / adenosine deaminase